MRNKGHAATLADLTPCAKSREDCCTKTAIDHSEGELHNNQPDNEDDDDDDYDRMRMSMRTRVMMMTRTRMRASTWTSEDEHP